MRRSIPLVASAVPRVAWDPAHHDSKWVDSYTKPIVKRRSWPTKKYSLVREPTNPVDWLLYSKRNMAYTYNAALRACTNFPEMIPYYQEMKERGVLIDIDTAFVLLSRAARYDKMGTEDLFDLAAELKTYGARFDVAVVEILHTVWEHSRNARLDWREARRRELVDEYNRLAVEDIIKYGEQGFDKLMMQEVHRYVRNLKSLGGGLRYDAWAAYFAQLRDPRDLALEVCSMLRARAPEKTETTLVRAGRTELIIPDMTNVLRRQSDADDDVQQWRPSCVPPRGNQPYTPHHYEDKALNAAFLAAVERIADAGFFENGSISNDRALATQLLLIIWQSRAMISADVFAQLMEIVKYSAADDQRDSAARAILRRAVRGANATKSAELDAWMTHERPLDARVVSRYIACVDPWASDRFCFTFVAAQSGGRKLSFEPFDASRNFLAAGEADAIAEKQQSATSAVASPASTSVSEAFASATGTVIEGDSAATTATAPPTTAIVAKKSVRLAPRTAADVDARVKDVLRLIGTTAPASKQSEHTHATQDTPAHLAPYFALHGGQLLSARAVFLKNLLAGVLGELESASAVLRHLAALKADIDATYERASSRGLTPLSDREEAPLNEGPEMEAWECLFITVNRLMDTFLSLSRGNGVKEQQAKATDLFNQAAKFRDMLLHESKDRYQGKFRALWLQEV